MKHKLVLIFADGDEVLNIEKVLVFNNEMDAKEYLLSSEHITSVEFYTTECWFKFKTNSWQGEGKAYWAIDKS